MSTQGGATLDPVTLSQVIQAHIQLFRSLQIYGARMATERAGLAWLIPTPADALHPALSHSRRHVLSPRLGLHGTLSLPPLRSRSP
jgi:hypothetical protein